ncbi:MAG: EAL domain-containing protein [Actinomycetota bacterium]|nr:EAL domain-containing protein [Actinomycetota bacterium]
MRALPPDAATRGRKRDQQALFAPADWPASVELESARVGDVRVLLDRIPAIIYIAQPGEHGVWDYVSPQIESILGFSPEEWLMDPSLWSTRLHPCDRERVLAGEAVSGMVAGAAGGAIEYRMLHCDGRVVWIRDDALLVRDELGRARWNGVLSDITERKQAEAELERRAAQQAAVARLGELALQRGAIAELIEHAVAAAAEILEVEMALVGELLPGGDSVRLRAGFGWADFAVGSVRAVGALGSGTLVTEGPVVVPDWDAEDRFEPSPTLRDHAARSSMTVAIEGHDGLFGVFGVHSTQPRTYSPGDIDFVQALANVLADALERQSTEDAIHHRALHDPLTGLPNRLLFLDRLEHTLKRLRRQSRSLAAVLFLDLDHFKLVNDSMGHHAGDELLAAVAARLKHALRPSDTVARFGGDEFGLVLEEISTERDAIAAAERIAAVFAHPFVLDADEHFVTTSIGIALAEGGEEPDELIRDADAAMYRAKERGRARYELFDEMTRGRAIARLRVENDLRRAVERDELRLVYQPVVSLRHEAIIGVEALLRWDHPQRGVVAPDDFIPVAEETGLIERIGHWVLDRACRQAAHWARAHQDSAPIGIAVNLSPLQLAQRGFPEGVADVLHGSGLDPASLSLEITETVLLDEADVIAENLLGLKSLGVKLVLDDFGTGYSSLSYLTRLPLDALKVDRSFIDGLGTEASDSTITEAIVGMARALSLVVVGEGIETDVQASALRRLRCGLGQGNLFSPPVSAAEISRMLNAGAGWRTTALG